MPMKFTIGFISCLILLQDVICNVEDQFFSKSLKHKENAFLDGEFLVASEAASVRVVRAAPAGWVSLSKYSLNLPEGVYEVVKCTGNSVDLIWLDPSHKVIKKSTSGLKVNMDKKYNQTSLEFTPVKTKHRGMYTCVNTKYNKSANFTLTVVSKPKVSISSDSKKFDVGDDFNITCKGNNPNITWVNGYNAQILSYPIGQNQVFMAPVQTTDSKSRSVLVFRNASLAQTGEYKCYLSVFNIQAEDRISLKIKPAKLEFSTDDEKSVRENEEFSITCLGKVYDIWWSQNGKKIGLNHPEDENVYVKGIKQNGRILEQKLYFENVEKNNDGIYICSGLSNYDGSLIQRSFRLNVKEDNILAEPIIRSRNPPMSEKFAKVQVNNPLTAVCIGETDEIEWLGPPHSWKIPQSSFPTSHIYTQPVPFFKKKLLLKFQNVTVADEGKYICRVTKRNTVVYNDFNLTVIIPASFNSTPSTYGANETSDIKMECVVNGRPKPQVMWYTNGKPIVNESKISYDGDSLVIRNVSYENGGKYICEAKQPTNGGYTIERAVNLEIWHKPYFPKSNVTIERIRNISSVIECNCTANPAARYTWYKDNVVMTTAAGALASDLSSNIIEVLLPMNNTDFELLLCNATNSYGSSVQTINVTAMSLPSIPVMTFFTAYEDRVSYLIAAQWNTSITYFNVEYREKSEKEWNEKNETKGDSWFHLYVVDDLKPKTDYLMRVRSVNPVGVSEFSKELSFKTSFANQLSASAAVLFAVIFSVFVLF